MIILLNLDNGNDHIIIILVDNTLNDVNDDEGTFTCHV